MDQIIGTYDGTNMELSGNRASFKLSWKGLLPITYSGTTSTVASITDNSVQLVAWTNNTDTNPTISYNARTRFQG